MQSTTKRPRLIYYNDAHHFHGKRVDPPVSKARLWQPVDALAGTGAEMLAFGIGYGDVFFHNSKVGKSILQTADVIANPIDWRTRAMARNAAAMGTDQVREVINRGKQLGVAVLPSLKMNNGQAPGTHRCGSLREERGEEVCLREPPSEWLYDYTHPDVRGYKLALIREMLDDYDADGIELDFLFDARYFRKADTELGKRMMSDYMAGGRARSDEGGADKGRLLTLAVRVFATEEENLRSGLDVRGWLEQGSLDIVVGQVSDSLFETTLSHQWLADVANANGVAAYIRPALRVFDERTASPSVEMYRAFSHSLRSQGFAGMYLGYIDWPFRNNERQILRDAAYPEITERLNKRYVLQPQEDPKEDSRGLRSALAKRDLPVVLEEGTTAAIRVNIADDLDAARAEGDLRRPVLTIRFCNLCIEDDVEYRLNSQVLSIDEAEVTHYRGVPMRAWERLQSFGNLIQATNMFIGHWFRWRLPLDLVRQGANTLEVETKQLESSAGNERSINGVEIQVRYNEFVWPEGLDVERVDPIAP